MTIEKLRNLYKNRPAHITVKQIADSVGMTVGYVCQCLNGKRQPSEEAMKKFEKFFNKI